jgi:hypothetical protein
MALHRQINLEIEDHTGSALDPRDPRPVLVTAVDAKTNCELWTSDGATLTEALHALADQLRDQETQRRLDAQDLRARRIYESPRGPEAMEASMDTYDYPDEG